MTDPRTVHEDLRYVRSVVHRADATGNPAIVYFLWAAITFVGYAIIDFFPEKSGLFWMVAGPLGGVLSGVLAWREARSAGQESSRDGRVHSLYWTGMMFAILLVIPLRIVGLVSIEALPRIVLLIVAFAYYAMGIFEDRKMLWVGMLVGAAYVLSIALRDFQYVWTITAACVAAGLVAAGIAARSSGAGPLESHP
jgi:hypothetical protein